MVIPLAARYVLSASAVKRPGSSTGLLGSGSRLGAQPGKHVFSRPGAAVDRRRLLAPVRQLLTQRHSAVGGTTSNRTGCPTAVG